MDRTFSSRIPYLAPAALWVFVQYYKQYTQIGLGIPECVKEYTNKYWEENDIYLMFIRDRISQAVAHGTVTDANPDGDRDLNSKLTLTEVYREFTDWHRESCPNMRICNLPAFKYEITQRLGDLLNGAWFGIQFKYADDSAGQNANGMVKI
jgi:phage/plasmid-associated DNA primase